MSGALPLEIGSLAEGEEASLLSPCDVAVCFLGLQCITDSGYNIPIDKIEIISYGIMEFLKGEGPMFDLGLEALSAYLQVRERYEYFALPETSRD